MGETTLCKQKISRSLIELKFVTAIQLKINSNIKIFKNKLKYYYVHHITLFGLILAQIKFGAKWQKSPN